MTRAAVNPEGLTWPEWAAAAGCDPGSVPASVGAWMRGEDPAEHRAAQAAVRGPVNPPADFVGQPFRGEQRVIVECRDPATGALRFTAPRPPVEPMRFERLYQLMWGDAPNADGSWPVLRAWLEARSWVVRPCTW